MTASPKNDYVRVYNATGNAQRSLTHHVAKRKAKSVLKETEIEEDHD